MGIEYLVNLGFEYGVVGIVFILVFYFLYLLKINKIKPYFKGFIPCTYYCINKPRLENHKLFQKFDQWNNIDIKNLEIDSQLKLLLEIKFKIWEDRYLVILKNKDLENISNKELQKYIIDILNATETFCKDQLEKKGIDKDIIDKFVKRHEARTKLLSLKLNYIIYDNYHYPNNNLKIAVFFSTSILTFDLAISHAKEIDKEIKKIKTLS